MSEVHGFNEKENLREYTKKIREYIDCIQVLLKCDRLKITKM